MVHFAPPHSAVGQCNGQALPVRTDEAFSAGRRRHFERRSLTALFLSLTRTICAEGDSITEPYLAAHNVILAHARAVSLYRSKYKLEQGGVIGMTLNLDWTDVRSTVVVSSSLVVSHWRSPVMSGPFRGSWHRESQVFGEKIPPAPCASLSDACDLCPISSHHCARDT